jgi:hypothetical protein
MPSSIFVRSDGEADIVAQGPGNFSLMYYWALPGDNWGSTQVTAATLSNPSIFVRSDGEADIVSVGADKSLMYYWALPGNNWGSTQVAPAGKTAGYTPSIFVRPDGEADIVAMGPDTTR